MTGGYSDFDRKLAKENMREMKVHVDDVDLWVSFMQWGHSEARKNGFIGYMAARNECKRFLLQCIRDVVSAQQSGQPTCLECGSQSFNDYQGYLKCSVCGSIPNR